MASSDHIITPGSKTISYITPNGEIAVLLETEKIPIKFSDRGHVLRTEIAGLHHKRSIVVMKYPWKVIPMNHYVNLREMSYPHESFPVININNQEQYVRQILGGQKVGKHLAECSQMNEFDEDDVSETGEFIGPFICNNGAQFIAELWTNIGGLPVSELSVLDARRKFDGQYERIAIEQLYYMSGVFICSMETDVESHHFVLQIIEDRITIYNTYGGTPQFFVTDFDRKKWLELYTEFQTATRTRQQEIYGIIWGIPPEITNQQFQVGFVGCLSSPDSDEGHDYESEIYLDDPAHTYFLAVARIL